MWISSLEGQRGDQCLRPEHVLWGPKHTTLFYCHRDHEYETHVPSAPWRFMGAWPMPARIKSDWGEMNSNSTSVSYTNKTPFPGWPQSPKHECNESFLVSMFIMHTFNCTHHIHLPPGPPPLTLTDGRAGGSSLIPFFYIFASEHNSTCLTGARFSFVSFFLSV